MRLRFLRFSFASRGTTIRRVTPKNAKTMAITMRIDFRSHTLEPFSLLAPSDWRLLFRRLLPMLRSRFLDDWNARCLGVFKEEVTVASKTRWAWRWLMFSCMQAKGDPSYASRNPDG